MWKRARPSARAEASLQVTATTASASVTPATPPLPYIKKRARWFRHALLAMVVITGLGVTAPVIKPAQAGCGDYCLCETVFHAILRSLLAMESAATAAYITAQFVAHREVFWGEWMWGYNIGNALMMWTNEISSTAMAQMFAVGAFFDAKHQLETQRLLQMKMVDAWRDYKPDVEMCTIGTAARGLGQTSRTGELTAFALSQQQIDRLTNVRNASGASGGDTDSDARIRLLKTRFCDARDGGGSMGLSVCNPASGVAGRNRDIDFNTTVMAPLTINVNLSDGGPATGPETDLFGLSSNLYAHRIFPPFPDHLLNSERGQSYLLDQRAIAAKRSVAMHSFGSIVGMKTAGSAASADNAQYIQAIYEQLGAPLEDARSLVGANPSYYAQMEALTKSIYQKPGFYTNLYDAPANVERKGAAIRAVRLIQDMDKFNSVLRSEQSLSVLLELYIEDMQEDVINADGQVGE